MQDEKVDVVHGAVSRKHILPETSQLQVVTMDPIRFILASPNYQWQGMALGIAAGNFSIKKQLFLSVGGFDEKMPRMVDFELGYRLFRAGGKIFLAPNPLPFI